MSIPIALLPSRWETERLLMQDGQLEEVPRLTTIFNACSYVGPWDKTFQVVPEAEVAGLVTKSLSQAELDRTFKLQGIRHKESPELLGYFHLYHGIRQSPEAVYISMFVIHPEAQGHKYGQEVVTGLSSQVQQLGYRAIHLNVFLKNWPALRFWIGQGFTTILDYRGAPLHTEESYADLLLEKRLA